MFFPFFRLNVSQSLHQHRINQYLGLNQQLFDLGVPAMDLSSQKIVDVSKRIRILFLCEFISCISKYWPKSFKPGGGTGGAVGALAPPSSGDFYFLE